MSTYNHAAITAGAAANASTINTPLGALDAAIGDRAGLLTNQKLSLVLAINETLDTLDTRIDNLIIGANTSPAETVDARDGFSLLLHRMRAAYLFSNVLLVDAGFATTVAAAHRFKTIALAMAAAGPGSVILVAPGVYTEDIVFAANDVKLIGSGAAGYDSTGHTFGVGTIIAGLINLNGKVRCSVRDLTVDVSGELQDGIISAVATAGNPGMYAEIRNVVIVGSGASAAVHGILLQTGGQNTIDNVRVYSIGHGIAVRSSYNNLSNIYIEDCGISGIILKSDTGSGNVESVNIFNAVLYASAGILVQSANAAFATRHINIANVSGFNTTDAVVSCNQVAGIVELVNVNNCQSSNNAGVGRGAFEVSAGGNEIIFGQCQVNYPSGYGFKNVTGIAVKLLGCTVQNSPGAKINGAFATTWVHASSITGTVAQHVAAFTVGNAEWATITGWAALVDLTGNVASAASAAGVAGIYHMKVWGSFAANVTGQRGLQFLVGAVQYGATSGSAVSNTAPTDIICEWTMALTAGQLVAVQAYQNSGGNLDISALQFTLELLESS